MILIADSGSSKTEWALLKKGNLQAKLQTDGFNPNYYSVSYLSTLVEKEIANDFDIEGITHLFFYGSGCSSKKNIDVINTVLRTLFKKTSIRIESDLLGASRSLFNRNKGIAAILGTGSNSCVYDGERIIQRVPSLGFILGDEGSGNNLGKRFLIDYSKNKLPLILKEKFDSKFQYSFDNIVDQIYHQPRPIKFLASLCPFIAENNESDYINQLIKSSFSEFFTSNILRFDEYLNIPIKFTGSIAEVFAKELNEVAQSFGLKISDIEKNPMPGLIRYHSTDL
ncbi:MAG: hypothetical protein GY834_05135 [Bacteroidetes bacterium]|nr:hypothetical protein [Bacteroidota bacterium]